MLWIGNTTKRWYLRQSLCEKNMTREERHLWYDFLQGYDITVLRIPNHEVNYNFQSVCEHIDLLVQQSLSQLR